MFLSAYESIQACQLMEELFGRVKQGFWTITGLNFKWKHKHKQWRRGKQSEENRGQQLQSSFTLLEHFPKSIFYILYTISKLRKSRIQLKDKFASCEFGTPTCEIKAYLAKWKWNTAAQSQRSPTCESDFATCKLGAQRAKMDFKLRNQLARFSQVTMQRAKSTCELGYLCTDSFRYFL